MDDNKYLLGSEPLADMVRSLLIREDDMRGTKFLKYFEIAKDVYKELNLYSIRYSIRKMFQVDKNTNSVILPKNTLLVTSIQVLDSCERLIPLTLNKNITGDFIDINLEKDCHCECGCESKMCGAAKKYEVIYKTVYAPMPNGDTLPFETYSRKTIYPNGDLFLEYNEPVPKYEDGVIVSTELEEFKKFICKLETKPCGCIKETKENLAKLDECCGANTFYAECGADRCNEGGGSLTYGYEEFGDRVSFASDFNYDRVIIRYFVNQKGGDIIVPIVAKKALHLGIQVDKSIFDESTGYTAIARQRKFSQLNFMYEREKTKLFRLINRYSTKEFYDTILPVRKMP